MAISATASKKETQFIWEGKDKRGHKVRGKALAANEAGAARRFKAAGVAANSRQDPKQRCEAAGRFSRKISRYSRASSRP